MLEDLIAKHGGAWSTRFGGFRCEEAWEPLVDDTVTKLRLVAPDAKITVVKEKFGRLAIYVEDKSDKRVRELLRGVEVLTDPPGKVDRC